MLMLSNIPDEIFLVALDYENIDRPQDVRDARMIYSSETARRGWTDGGFERAINEYMTLSGAFSEDGGEFAGINGYTI